MSIFQKIKDLVAATDADATAFHEKGNRNSFKKSISGNKGMGVTN